MQISALVDIVQGKLLNSPAISFITQIHTNIIKVNDGDAFFARSPVNIKKALQQGAFAIILTKNLYDKLDITLFDSEIAWILVDDLKKSIWKLLRYKLSFKSVKVFHVDSIAMSLINSFKTKEMDDILLLSGDITNDFEKLNYIEKPLYLFGVEEEFLEYISVDVEYIKRKRYVIKNLSFHSLFETSFSNKDRYFAHVKLPYVYVNNFLQLLEYFPYELDMKRLNGFELFKPIFLNRSNDIVSHGQSNRFVVANINIAICDIEIKYLKTNYKYANLKIIDFFDFNEDSLYDYFQKESFNALYVKNCSREYIVQLLSSKFNENQSFF